MQKIVNVLFKKLDPQAQIPKQAHPGDAGMDLYACLDDFKVVIHPGAGVLLIGTKIAMAMPSGWEAQCRPRSGMGIKHGITVINAPGTIDAGYRGEIGIGLINLGNEPYTVKHGDRIAQLVISEVPHVDVEEVDELPDSERGTGGFGSTGR